MKITEVITSEMLARYQYSRRPIPRKPLRMPIVRPVMAPKPFPRTKPLAKPLPKPVRNSKVHASQTRGLNPRIDVTKGPGFKLDNTNIIAPVTDLDKKLNAMEKQK